VFPGGRPGVEKRLTVAGRVGISSTNIAIAKSLRFR